VAACGFDGFGALSIWPDGAGFTAGELGTLTLLWAFPWLLDRVAAEAPRAGPE
jgi:hypothetical protein